MLNKNSIGYIFKHLLLDYLSWNTVMPFEDIMDEQFVKLSAFASYIIFLEQDLGWHLSDGMKKVLFRETC